MDTSSQTLKQEQPVVHLTSGDAAKEQLAVRPSRLGLWICTTLFLILWLALLFVSVAVVFQKPVDEASPSVGWVFVYLIGIGEVGVLFVWVATMFLVMVRRFWWAAAGYFVALLFLLIIPFMVMGMSDVGTWVLPSSYLGGGVIWLGQSAYLLFASRVVRQTNRVWSLALVTIIAAIVTIGVILVLCNLFLIFAINPY